MTQQYELTNGQIVTLNNNTEVAGGAKLYVYEAGTTTPLDTYSDSGLSTPNANPVVADANGRFGAIFLAADDYKFVCKSSDDATTFFTVDDYKVEGTLTFTGGLEQDGTTVQLASGANNQTGTSYTILTSDRGKLVTFSNASAISVTLPTAGASFPDGFYFDIANRNEGIVTLTSTSNIDGESSVTFNRSEGARVVSDGSTYYLQGGVVRDIIFKDGGELVIASGAITVSTQTSYSLDTEGGASSDDLDTINGEIDGKVITLSLEDAARNVVVKHNTGNIYNPAGQDITLDATQDIVELRYDATLTKWIVMSYQNADTELKPLTQGTEQASTSGTEIDFTVPSGIKTVTVLFNGVSTDGTDVPLIQIGDSGGIETSSYNARGGYGTAGTTSTSGFPLSDNYAAAQLIFGSFTLSNLDGANEWIGSGTFSLIGGTNKMTSTAGVKELSAELTTIRITTTGGTDAFDAGSINILYQK